jgi:phosphoribosylformylglycinamidine synthase
MAVSVPVSGVSKVLRVEVASAPGCADPIGDALKRDAAGLGVTLASSRAKHVYLIEGVEGSPISAGQLDLVRGKLLADPVTEVSFVGASPSGEKANARLGEPGYPVVVEVHPLPGVMDPVALSVSVAIGELLGLKTPPRVSTGWRYDIAGTGVTRETAMMLAGRLLANPVIQRIHAEPFWPKEFPHSGAHEGGMGSVKLIGLGDAELTKLSREAHLFLSLEEMRAVQEHYKQIGRDPREIELETLAQTWSEHCVHKTLKSRIVYREESGEVAKWQSGKVESHGSAHSATLPLGHSATSIDWNNRPGHTVQPDGSVVIDNLLKRTVAAATHKLIADGVDWTLSVFVDNSGVVAFDEKHAVCIKVETHNHPSAIEPYGGAATGVGGCVRDVIGTGLGARPIANTDVFCVAEVGSRDQGTKGSREEGSTTRSHDPLIPRSLPEGCLPPERILRQVVAGVRDYGNRMGIPTVSGGVYFDDRYVGNPLVFCGCIGVMGREHVKGVVKAGDLIVALGGRTGRDGLHGATFSSAELEHTASDEFSHAVQIGNAITEKQVLDAIMRARDEFGRPLYNGMTDCGAGGFSSAIGEMGKDTGATVHLDKAPLKYAGLSATEIWISEAQERMVLAVPQANLAKLETICREEHVEMAVLGTFAPAAGSTAEKPELALMFHGKEVGRMDVHFMHEGIPTPKREAVWRGSSGKVAKSQSGKVGEPSVREALLKLLAHPNIASKHWIVRQYDHEVRGGTAVKPLVGPLGRGPGDASVIMPVAGSHRGLAISQGLQTGIGDPEIGGDPYLMVLAAIDECVRNLVCVGCDPERIAILDNFCWPSCSKPENLGSLVRAAVGCYDGAMAYRTPFVSGKDSLNNQFTTKDGKTIEIPPTLLITGMGIVADVRKCVTMDAKRSGNVLMVVGPTSSAMGGSHYQRMFGGGASGVPHADLVVGPKVAKSVARVIGRGMVAAAHDVSDGGVVCAVAEMLIAGSTERTKLGAKVDVGSAAAAFGEGPSRYVLEVEAGKVEAVKKELGVECVVIGEVDGSGEMKVNGERVGVEEMAKAWLGTLDW